MPVFGQAVQPPIVSGAERGAAGQRKPSRAEADGRGDDEGQQRSEKQPHVRSAADEER